MITRLVKKWLDWGKRKQSRRDVSAASVGDVIPSIDDGIRNAASEGWKAGGRFRLLANDLTRIHEIAIRRLHVVPVPPGAGISVMHKLTMLSEFSRLGYRVVNPEMLDSASPELFLDYRGIIATLVAMRGGRVAYEPLFPGFPLELPDEHDNFVYPLIDYVSESPQAVSDASGVVLEIVSPEEAILRLKEWLLDAMAAPQRPRLADSPEGWWEDVAVVRRLLGGKAIDRRRQVRQQVATTWFNSQAV